MQLKDMTQLLSLSILRNNINKYRRTNRLEKIAPDIGEQSPDKNICDWGVLGHFRWVFENYSCQLQIDLFFINSGE